MNPTLIPALRHLLEQAGYPPGRYEPLLTEVRQIGNRMDDLEGFVDGMKQHVLAAAKMYGATVNGSGDSHA